MKIFLRALWRDIEHAPITVASVIACQATALVALFNGDTKGVALWLILSQCVLNGRKDK